MAKSPPQGPRKFTIESTLELLPDCEAMIEASGYGELESESLGEDADGRRGQVKTTISEVTVVCLWAFFPGRPPVCLAQTPKEVYHFVTKVELGGLEDLACTKIFLEEQVEEWEE